MIRKIAVGLAVIVMVLGSGACGVLNRGVYDTPLPGGADLGSHPVTITADFEDVLDLVPQSSVRVDNVAVGRVSGIDLNEDGRSARVTLLVNGDTDLPAGTTARLQQTTLLGEKYVALVRSDTTQAGAPLKSGDHIGLAETSQAAEVEQVLGALSMVLNGGGIEQFQEISRELTKVSEGRPKDIRAFLNTMDTFVTGLDDRKESITAALDSLNRLSTTLNDDRDKIISALDGLQPGMQVIVDQRKQLVSMLSALDKLSTVTVRTLNASQDDIVADFKALEPILAQLAKAGQDLPNSLQILLTYPFPDSVLGAIKGDYLNVFVETNFRTLPSGCVTAGCMWSQPDNSVDYSGSSSASTMSAEMAPSLLPPTDSPVPGSLTPSLKVPTESVPTSVPGHWPAAPPTKIPTTPPTPAATSGDEG